MSRGVFVAEVLCFSDKPVELIDLAVSLLQTKGGEIGENFSECFVRELKYCKRSAMSIPSGCERCYLGCSEVRVQPGLAYEWAASVAVL